MAADIPTAYAISHLALHTNLHNAHASKQASSAICITNSKIGSELDLPIFEWVDKSKPTKGIIIAVPGMTLYAFSWNDMASHLASKGYTVYALDQRGFGRWRNESAKFGGDSKIEIGQSQQDLLDLVTTLRQAHPKQKILCLGESMGSNMALLLASDHPELVDGLILGSPCYKTRMHAKPLRWAADFAKTIVRPNRLLNLEPYAAPYLTNDPVLARTCDNDPLIYRKMSAADLIKIDVMNDRAIESAKSLPADFPVLVIAGAKDAMFKSQELPKAIEKFGTKRVQFHLLSGAARDFIDY
jgi:alpha-beta hydrolase superfamily lysophospholipase